MKPITRLTLAALLTTAVFGTAVADTDFGTYRHNPMAAIEAGDAMGLEVIPRSELEEVRGEGWPIVVLAGGTLAMIAYLHYKWVTDPEWIMSNPAAKTMWDEIRN
jgi:hypothetical protein